MKAKILSILVICLVLALLPMINAETADCTNKWQMVGLSAYTMAVEAANPGASCKWTEYPIEKTDYIKASELDIKKYPNLEGYKNMNGWLVIYKTYSEGSIAHSKYIVSNPHSPPLPEEYTTTYEPIIMLDDKATYVNTEQEARVLINKLNRNRKICVSGPITCPTNNLKAEPVPMFFYKLWYALAYITVDIDKLPNKVPVDWSLLYEPEKV